jgi:WD40 repeat protein
MPPWLRLIATARNEAGVTDRLRALRFHPLDAGSPGNRDDVRTWIASRLAGNAAVSAHHVDTLCAKSDGNFLYAVQTLQDVEAGHLRLEELDQLPPGLGGRYLAFFERHFPDGEGFASMKRLLDAMVAAAEPLHASQLAEATGIDAEEDLPRLVRDLRQYLKHQADWGRDPVCAFYHKSLSDWLTAPERRGDRYTASVRKGHAALADWLWEEYVRGRARWPAYLLRHLPAHLLTSGRWDDLAVALRDPDYLETRVESGEVTALAADLAAATGAEGMPADHPARGLLRRIEEAIRRDLPFIARHPATLFQCLWNSCWWYDCPDAAGYYDPPRGGWGPDGPPWNRPALAPWMQAWREAKQRAGPFVWVRSLRPPPVPLGGALRATCTGHTNGVSAVAFSPDGQILASASQDGTIRLWNPNSGHEVARLHAHDVGVKVLCWSPDGQLLASGGLDDVSDSGDEMDATVQVWDREGREVECLFGHERGVTALAWSPDGCLLASAADWDTVRLWNASRGYEEVACLLRHKSQVTALAWSPDGCLLACALEDASMVRVWDREGRKRTSVRGHEEGVSVHSLSWSPDSRLLASAWPDDRRGQVRLWDAKGGRELACLRGGADGLSASKVSWSPDGHLLAVTSLAVHNTCGAMVRLWNVEGGRELVCLSGHEGGLTALAWSPDGRVLASAGDDLWLWDAMRRRALACLSGHEGGVTALAWSPDGRLLASGSHDKTVRLWVREGGRELARLCRHDDDVLALSWSPDGCLLASGSHDKTVRLWDADGRERACLRRHEDVVIALSWSPDGEMLASASVDETVRLWDRDGRELACLGKAKLNRTGFAGPNYRLNWSPNGQVLASALGDDGTVRLWTCGGDEIACLRGHERGVCALSWSPNGRLLASGSTDKTIRLWGSDGHEVACLRGHEGSMWELNWSPDSRLLASRSIWDKSVRIWDAEGGRELACRRGHDKTSIRSLAWTDEGRVLQMVDDAARVTIWCATGWRPPNTKEERPQATALRRSKGTCSVGSRSGELVFVPLGEEAPVAWFPVDCGTAPADARTWAGASGSEVYLLRLEGVRSVNGVDSGAT